MGGLRVGVIGLGYFSQFHLDGWLARDDVQVVAVCDRDPARVSRVADQTGAVPYVDAGEMLAVQDLDIVDIVAPPSTHSDLVWLALKEGRTIVCQKPFCTSIEEAEKVVFAAKTRGTRLIVHENFRFQPWHREIRDFLTSGRMGQVYQARFALRPGDGRGPKAYLDRQPAFQTMPRLLVYETAVHQIDLFRFFFGPIRSVYADLRRLNTVIAGEDAGMIICEHTNGVRSVFDGNRLSDHVADNPRLTMGESVIEGEGGSLSLDGFGTVQFRPFGAHNATDVPVKRPIIPQAFGGGCTAAVIDHVVDALAGKVPFENEAEEYLAVMHACDAAYVSAETGRKVVLQEGTG